MIRTILLVQRTAKNTSHIQSSPVVLQTIRTYRGDSGDMKHRSQVAETAEDEIVKREEALLKIAEPKYDKIQARHVRMPKLEEIPKASLQFAMQESGDYTLDELELEVRRKRLVYRAKQRGW